MQNNPLPNLPPANPYTRMRSALTAETFFGRAETIQAILEGVSAQEPVSYQVYGLKTIGKTSLLRRLAEAGLSPGGHRAFLHFGRAAGAQIRFIYLNLYGLESPRLLAAIHAALAAHLAAQPFGELNLEPGEWSPAAERQAEMRESLLRAFQQLRQQNVRLVLLLDHVDRVIKEIQPEDDLFLRSLTTLQAFVIAAEQSLAELQRALVYSSPMLNVLQERPLGLLDVESARQLASRPAAAANAPFGENELRFLEYTAGAHPNLLTIACEFLFHLRRQFGPLETALAPGSPLEDELILQIAALPEVQRFFAWLWKQLDAGERQSAWQSLAPAGPVEAAARLTAARLKQRGLLVQDGPLAAPRPFCELFRRYIQSQAAPPPARPSGGEAARLTPIDRQVLEYLSERANQLVTYDELQERFWPGADKKRGLEASIFRLRQHFAAAGESDWEHLHNVRGKGFIFTPRSN